MAGDSPLSRRVEERPIGQSIENRVVMFYYPFQEVVAFPSRPLSASSDHADGHGVLCRETLHLASLNRF